MTGNIPLVFGILVGICCNSFETFHELKKHSCDFLEDLLEVPSMTP